MKSILEFRILNFDLRNSGGVGLSRQKRSQTHKSTFQNQHSKIVVALAFGAALTASASHFDGSRTLPVHRIPLSDEEGQTIVSSVPASMPFSARLTCGACHDYEKIHGGTHFGGTGQGRPAEPWIVVDEATGTQVPAEQMNLSAWEFTKQFGSHLPGGGISDPVDPLADPDARWEISGGLEINCLACHNNSHRQDMTEWTKQIGRENFRWAATAASGIGEVGGMASRLPDWWNIHSGGNPDDHSYAVPPSVDYDPAQFDSKHRMWFDIGKPQDTRCLQCHSAHPVGAQRMDVPGDVHAAAGLACVDCHRNGEDHQNLRGTTDAMSCSSCHVETGQHGAPIAHHKGIPPIHFEKMTCTACHSGLPPAAEPQMMRTSRANRLGIYGRAQWFTESPFIVEPVFVRNAEGRIEPRRMMWPAFWAYSDGSVLDQDLVEEAATGVLDAARQVGDVLTRLADAEDAQGEPLFAANGNLYRRNADGGLDLAGSTNTELSFLWSTESNMVSTIPDFDVNAEEIDYDAEGAIVGIMDAFKPLELVVSTKGKVFSKDADGYLVGTNTTLATGWHTKDGQPLVSSFQERAVVDTVGTSLTFNEEQLAVMLQKLGPTTCYISNGRKFTLSDNGELIDEDHEAAEPVSWAIGHDVRSAAQSLGARQCEECHAADSPFLFGTVTATGPLLTDRAKVVPMHEFQGLESGFNQLFGLTFKVRKCFKSTLGVITLLLSLIALAFGLPAIHRLAGKLDEKELPLQPVLIALIGTMTVLAITGFLFGWPLGYPLNGFPLLSHVGFGALYAIVLTGWALLRAKSGGNVWFWLLVVCGIVLILSVLIAMFPILGTHGQHVAIIVHRVAAILSIIAAAMGCLAARKKG
jgi:hypothetical protein